MLSEFLADLTFIAPSSGAGTYAFTNERGEHAGYVQIVPQSETEVTLHRLWTIQRRCGNGSFILKELCELADRHGIVLKLRALPIGAKPYSFSREELVEWYGRHGFEVKRRKMVRVPRLAARGPLAFKTLRVGN